MRIMARQEPCLEPLMLQLKYGPWRSALAAAWAQQSRVQSPVFRVPSVKERAQALHTALVTAVEEISKSGVSRHWGQNCGRGVGRHSGGAPVLRHLGVLVAVCAGRPGMRFHERETEGEVSDDSDDEVQCPTASAWKYGPVKKSHA